jgi:hypothetical protein
MLHNFICLRASEFSQLEALKQNSPPKQGKALKFQVTECGEQRGLMGGEASPLFRSHVDVFDKFIFASGQRDTIYWYLTQKRYPSSALTQGPDVHDRNDLGGLPHGKGTSLLRNRSTMPKGGCGRSNSVSGPGGHSDARRARTPVHLPL